MSYSVYVTRRENWHDSGGQFIALSEWQEIVESDAELSWSSELGDHFATWSGSTHKEKPWINWENGNLESKNADSAVCEKLSLIAAILKAKLVSEEDQQFDRERKIFLSKAPSRLSQLLAWMNYGLFGFRTIKAAEPPPFKIGDRVRGLRGRVGTVLSINLKAERGLGIISVRFDDGRVEKYSAIAHILVKAE